jgi:predicted flap endonuclease-1-like 5' DNA nuclease
MSFSSFCWGLLVGFLLEWLCDWIFWRKARPTDTSASGVTQGYSGSSSIGGLAGGAAAASGLATSVSGVALPPGIAAFRQDDLEAIEGIGPKIAELMRAAGITTFSQLAVTPMDKIVSILDAGGPRFKLANPGTWAEQASLAANNDWVGFDKIKKELVAGVRSSDV